MAKDQFWTDARVKRLKDLWMKGRSASEIAEAIGGLSRNAVIGKAHRLGLSGRASPIRNDISAKPKPKQKTAPKGKLPSRGGVAKAAAGGAKKKKLPVKVGQKQKPTPAKGKKPQMKAKPPVKKAMAPARKTVVAKKMPAPAKAKDKAPAKLAPAARKPAAAPPAKKPVAPPVKPAMAPPSRQSAPAAKGKPVPQKAPERAAEPVRKPEPKAGKEKAPKGKAKKISILELGERMCRWPFGDPKSPDFHFCGNPTLENLPYCAEHAPVAYQTRQPGNRKR